MAETTSFDDFQIAVYRWSRAIEIVSGPQNSVLWPTKMAEMAETTRFDNVQIVVYQGSRSVEIVPGTKNSVLWPTKMARNGRKDEF